MVRQTQNISPLIELETDMKIRGLTWQINKYKGQEKCEYSKVLCLRYQVNISPPVYRCIFVPSSEDDSKCRFEIQDHVRHPVGRGIWCFPCDIFCCPKMYRYTGPPLSHYDIRANPKLFQWLENFASASLDTSASVNAVLCVLAITCQILALPTVCWWLTS